MPRCYLTAALALAPVIAQTPTPNACQVPDETRAILRDAARDPSRDASRPYQEILAENRARLTALLEKHPDNFWIARQWVTQMAENMVAPESVVARMRERHEAAPENQERAFLYALALTGRNTPEAIRILDRIAEKSPEFPWTWQQRVMIYSSPVFRNESKAKEAAERLIDLCPDSSEALSAARNSGDSPKVRDLAARTRARLTGKTDPTEVSLWPMLWNLEFKITPIAEHARLRAQVAEDLKFLETLAKKENRTVGYVLSQGYRMVGDTKAEAAARASMPGMSSVSSGFFEALSKWQRENPYPGGADAREKRKAMFEAKLKLLDEWVEKIPDEPFVHAERLRALSEVEAPKSELLSAGERALEASRKRKSSGQTFSGIELQVAAVWVKHEIELERIPALVAEGRAAARRMAERMNSQSDLYRDPGNQAMLENNRWQSDTESWQLLARAYAKTGEPDAARQALMEWENALSERRKKVAELKKAKEGKPEPAPVPQGMRTAGAVAPADRGRMFEDMMIRGLPWDETRLLEAKADVALAAGRKLDALQFQTAGIRVFASQTANWQKTPSGEKLQKMWTEMGGTQEGWQALVDSMKPLDASGKPAAPASRFTDLQRPLPDTLSLSDITGKTWTLAQFKGKTTLINVWATWCGPCREELPHLQKLHDRIKEREDLQVITLNVDESAGPVEPFLQQNKYTFPVLLAKQFLDGFTGPLGIPTNWISDRNATLRTESVGFGGDGEDWIKQTLAKLESVREAK